MTTPDLPTTIQQIRLTHNLTQSDVAAALGVTPGYISNIENGRTALSLRVLIYYARLDHRSLEDMVGGTDTPGSSGEQRSKGEQGEKVSANVKHFFTS